MNRTDARRRPPRRLRRFVLRLIGLGVAAAVVAAGAIAVLVIVTPSVADAADRVAAQARAHGAHVETTVPTRVAAALIATEDSRFATDPGIDPLGVLRWAGGTVEGRSDAGGATLDQQLAKLLYTDGRQDPVAEAEQVGLALKLAHTYSRPRSSSSTSPPRTSGTGTTA